ncbi:MAG: pantoate--beta-alanine ligase, partial [Candidatus Promineifilaceae bacterium]
ADILRSAMIRAVEAEPLARLDYFSVADPDTLEELLVVDGQALLSGAVFFGNVRLIDNILLA